MTWCFFPTPYHPFDLPLRGLSELWIKRDDLNGLAGGGNKTRKLRHYLQHIQAQGYTALVTEGAPQSNHCRQTAAMGAANGLKVVLVLGGNGPRQASGNLLIDEILGAEMIHCSQADRPAEVESALKRLEASGHRPLHIPVGGSAPIGVEAYAEGIGEWYEEQRELGWLPDTIVHASSSGGTQAGLALGVARLDLPIEVLGISVDHSKEVLSATVEALIDATETNPDIAARAKASARYSADYLGHGYAKPTSREADAISFTAKHSGIILDPVYSGRAMVGFIDMVEQGHFDSKRVVFWHTGGMPSIHPFGSPSSWPCHASSNGD